MGIHIDRPDKFSLIRGWIMIFAVLQDFHATSGTFCKYQHASFISAPADESRKQNNRPGFSVSPTPCFTTLLTHLMYFFAYTQLMRSGVLDQRIQHSSHCSKEPNVLGKQIQLTDFPAIFQNKFCDFLIPLMYTKSAYQKGSALKGKNLHYGSL